jgi:hypothetical protein
MVIYYEGDELGWVSVGIGAGVLPPVYFYSENEPALREDGVAYVGKLLAV